MSKTQLVQTDISLLHFLSDPSAGFCPHRCAGCDHFGKGSIRADLKNSPSDRFGKAAGQVKLIWEEH